MAFPDYEEFIAALNDNGVRYLIVGAHAVAHHSRPRATKDLDLLIDPTPANARRVLAALRDFFGADSGYTVEDLTDRRWMIQLGVAPVRIDLLPEIQGCRDFASAWEGRVDAPFGTVAAHYLGLDDLIVAKQAAGRLQDRADVRALKRVQQKPSARTRRR